MGANSPHVHWDQLDEWLHSNCRTGRMSPGNVRELQNNLRDWILGLEPHSARRKGGSADPMAAPGFPARMDTACATMDEVQRWYFARVLAKFNGSVALAAGSLGVNRSTAYRWLRGSVESNLMPERTAETDSQ